MNVTFSSLPEPRISAMQCVALNIIDPSNMVDDLLWSSVNITPPRPVLFLSA